MTKEELVLRLAPLMGTIFAPLKEEAFVIQLRNIKKPVLYAMARQPEFALPLTTDMIAER